MAFTTDDLPRKTNGQQLPKGQKAYYEYSPISGREIICNLLDHSDITSWKGNNKQLLINELNKLAILPTGAKVMQQVSSYLAGNNRKLTINFTSDPGKNTNFEASDKLLTPAINIRIDEFKKDKNGSYYSPLPEITSRARIGNQDVFEIAPGKTPLFMTLGHELMHFAKNIYTQKNSGEEPKIRFPDKLSKESILKRPIFRTPRMFTDDLMYQTDEYKNVVGKSWKPKHPNETDEFSELTLRMEAGLNPRYIYQPSMYTFLESGETIRQVIGDDNYQKMLQKLPIKKVVRSSVSNPENEIIIPSPGSPEEKEFLKYTPLSVLKQFYPLDKQQQLASISGTGAPTIKDRQQRLAPYSRLHRRLIEVLDKDKEIYQTQGLIKMHQDTAYKAFQDTASALKKAAQKIATQNNLNEEAVYRFMVNEYNNQRGENITYFNPLTIQNSSAPPAAPPPPPTSNTIMNNAIQKQLRAKLNRMLFKRFIKHI